MNAIELNHVSKVYRKFGNRRQFATLKSALLSGSLVRDLKPDESFTAVSDVTVKVPAGRTLGVIGRNGSGKSTLLKLVAGITKPSTGELVVRGRISALIELGAGFHPEISGRENVFINGIMLGLTKKEVARRFDEIVEFAELQDFIDAPVKTYSSGMYMRLGFAVAIHVDPDVLLVDEVLAVGDEGFTHKCLDKFAEFKRRGKTILLVTHSLGLVERFCDEALWMDAGRMKALGDPKRVVGAYVTDVEHSEEQQLAAADARAQESATSVSPDEPALGGPAGQSHRIGDGSGRHVPGDRGPLGLPRDRDHRRRVDRQRWRARRTSSTAASRLAVRMRLRAPLAIDDFVVGIGIFNAEGVCCYGTNTDIEELKARRSSATSKPCSRSTAWTSWKAPTSWTSPSTSWTAIPTTTTACCTRSA